MTPGHEELALMLANWLRDDTEAFVAERYRSDTRLYVEGPIDCAALAAYVIDLLDACPCDCTGNYVARVESGGLTGPYRSAYTCSSHRFAVMAWAISGTGLPANFIPMEGKK